MQPCKVRARRGLTAPSRPRPSFHRWTVRPSKVRELINGSSRIRIPGFPPSRPLPAPPYLPPPTHTCIHTRVSEVLHSGGLWPVQTLSAICHCCTSKVSDHFGFQGFSPNLSQSLLLVLFLLAFENRDMTVTLPGQGKCGRAHPTRWERAWE